MSEIVIKEAEIFKQFDILLNEEIIGSAEIKYPDMTLNNFFIYPEYRNKGYGQKVLKDFIDNFGITNLWVDPNNEIAKHIYQKLGFTLDETPNYIAMRLKNKVK